MIPLTQTDEVALPARRPVQGQQLELLTCSPAFVIKADRLHPLVLRASASCTSRCVPTSSLEPGLSTATPSLALARS